MAQIEIFASNVTPLSARSGAWLRDPIESFRIWMRSATYTPLRSQFQRNFSPASQRAYKTIFGRYVRHLGSADATLQTATAAVVADFIERLSGRNAGRASYETVRRSLTLLDRLHSELQKVGVRRDNPVKPLFSRFVDPSNQSPITTVMSPHQHRLLTAYIGDLPRTRFEDARRAALLAVLAGCGLTGYELRTLPCKAVVLDESPERIWLPQLGQRAEATIALARFALPILLDYRRVLSAQGHRGNLFFPATIYTDSPLSHQTLHRYVVAALKAIGIEDRIGAQRVLRVNLAVRLLEYNFSEQKVQEILRLREDTMVKRYRRHTMVEMPF